MGGDVEEPCIWATRLYRSTEGEVAAPFPDGVSGPHRWRVHKWDASRAVMVRPVRTEEPRHSISDSVLDKLISSTLSMLT